MLKKEKPDNTPAKKGSDAMDTSAKSQAAQPIHAVKKKKKKFKMTKKKVIAVILILAIAGGCYWYFGMRDNAQVVTTERQNAQVERGSIAKSVEGSGQVEAISQYEVTALGVKGEILGCYFEEGDTVQEGQLLYTIDASDMESSIENAKSSLEKAQLSYDDTLKKYNEAKTNQTVSAPISGVITALNVKNGDDVNSGFQAVTIKNSDTMKLSINFNASDAKNIWRGQQAQVKLENSFSTLSGTVEHVGSGTTVSAEGVAVTAVEITVTNPGAIKEGDKATAIIGDLACNSPGEFQYSDQKDVVTKLAGEVYGLGYQEGDYITQGTVLFKIDPAEDMETTLKSAKLSLDDAKTNLNSMNEDLKEYSITAPITGEIIQRNIKAGEKLDNSNGSEPMAIIADLSTLTFDMSIDELDIANVEVGQRVDITAEAYEDEQFSGYVDKISIVGNSEQGVTTYPVTVIVDSENKDLLIPGMNVDANIVIAQRDDVLRVPVSAINRGNIVIAKTDAPGVEDGTPAGLGAQDGSQGAEISGAGVPADGDAPAGSEPASGGMPGGAAEGSNPFTRNLDIPEGYKAVQVEVGLSDNDYVEIISGLNEGDTVILNQETQSDLGTMAGMMGGRMGGAAPMQGGPGPR